MSTTPTTRLADLAAQSVLMMGAAPRSEFFEVYHARAVNREARTEPPECRQPGPEGFFATALWLRGAFSELTFKIERVVTDGDLAVTYGTMSGRQTGTMITYAADGTVERAFAPTGRRFTTRQAHFLRLRDGLIGEHWAVRDDLAQAQQLRWIPPTPAYLIRCARATAKARRDQSSKAAR
ncbi:ester cyclase [Micromonospora sediminicola]|uniref:ester cyclase n=1 Tax=Micromonospora sediminicola TaxID=946078 RepID=UPI00378E44B5